MNRKEFIEKSILMGIGLPFLSSTLFQSCSKDGLIFPDFTTNFSGKVLIIGAGAAGMAAGYVLKRYGVDFEIIEASSVYGGRLKEAPSFVDFPIDLGAEWIHTDPKILAEILSNPDKKATVDVIVYNPQTVKSWNQEKLKSHNFISNFYSEWKFKNSTWYSFFEDNIIPDILEHIRLNKPVSEISYDEDKVTVKTVNNEVFEGDKIIVTASMKVLQSGAIAFNPPLPEDKDQAIQKVFMGDGIKIFVEFKEKFYPDILAFGNIFQALNEEEKFVYDAAFRKDTTKNVLGLFAINEKANVYTKLNNEQEIINQFLAELDAIFDGQASKNYVNHIIQNWSKEPYIKGAYSYSFDGDQEEIVKAIKQPILNKVYFAGEALSIEDQAMVQGACKSAYETVTIMLKEN